MSVFTRFKSILQVRVNEAAEVFEDPRASLDYSLAKLEETHSQIGRSLIEVSAALAYYADHRQACTPPSQTSG